MNVSDSPGNNKIKRLVAMFDEREAPVFEREPSVVCRARHNFTLERQLVPRGSLSTHVLNEHCLMLPRGRLAVAFNARVNGKPVRGLIEPDRLQFRARGDSVATGWNDTIDAIFLAISPDVICRAMGEDHMGESVELHTDLQPRDHATLQGLSLTLEAYLHHDAYAGALFEESLLTAIAAQLVQTYGASRRAAATAVPLSRRTRARLENFLRESISDDLSVTQIARAVGYSPHHLCHLFRQSTGRSLWQYVLQYRVAEARRLILRGRSMPLGQIAQACGFGSYGQFIAAFRKEFGQTPSQFRRARDR